MGTAPGLVIFTDLDGTLLDGATYRYDAARPTLQRLKKIRVPLVFCTSKTRAEVEPLRRTLDNDHPFIIENGGALYVPEGYFTQAPMDMVRRPPYGVIEFGTPYESLRLALRNIEQEVGIGLRGFGDMTPREVAVLTGLSETEAALARNREYDEPFVPDSTNGEVLERLQAAAGSIGLTVVSGGRFCHLMGGTDKGKACRVLRSMFEKEHGPVTTAAFGDGLNDLPMLQVVDYPFLVERASGGYPEGLEVPGLVRLPGRGPVGWVRGIELLLQRFEPGP